MDSASALRPRSIATRPWESNFITMLLISSTAQISSAGSTRTWGGGHESVGFFADFANVLARAIERELVQTKHPTSAVVLCF